MTKKNNRRWVAATLLAISLAACGSIQGASPARAGVPAQGGPSDVHLTEFDANDTQGAAIRISGDQLQQAILLDQQNEQQRLARQGANAPGNSLGSDSAGSTFSAPALVP